MTSKVDSGFSWSFALFDKSVNAVSSYYVGLATGDNPVEMDDIVLLTDGESVAGLIYEAVDFTVGDTARLSNRNRIEPKALGFTIKNNVAVASVPLDPNNAFAVLGVSGTKNNIDSADTYNTPNWLLKPNTNYIYEIKNLDAQQRNFTALAEFFERPKN